MEGVWSRREYLNFGSGYVICARDLATLQLCPHIRVSLQHMVLRKKMHEVYTRYLARDLQADVLAQLGCQQTSCSASEFYKVELSSMWWIWIQKRYTIYVLGVKHASKCQQLLWVHSVLNFWACTHTSGYVNNGHCTNDQNRSHTISHVAWAYHLCLVAMGILPAAQGLMYKILHYLFSYAFNLFKLKHVQL